MSYVLTWFICLILSIILQRWYTHHYVHFTEETGARSGQFAQGRPASELTSACCYCSFASSCSFPHFVNSTPVFSWEITPSHRLVYVVPMGPTSLTASGEGWDSSLASQPIRLEATVQDEPIRSKDTAEELEVCCPGCHHDLRCVQVWCQHRESETNETSFQTPCSRPHTQDPYYLGPCTASAPQVLIRYPLNFLFH